MDPSEDNMMGICNSTNNGDTNCNVLNALLIQTRDPPLLHHWLSHN